MEEKLGKNCARDVTRASFQLSLDLGGTHNIEVDPCSRNELRVRVPV